jgi:hypothetical protein
MTTKEFHRFAYELVTGGASMLAFVSVVCNHDPLPVWLWGLAIACIVIGGPNIYRACDRFARSLA